MRNAIGFDVIHFKLRAILALILSSILRLSRSSLRAFFSPFFFGSSKVRSYGVFILSFALLSFSGCSDSRPRITERDGLAPTRTRDPVAMAIDRGINRDRPDLFPHGVVEARGVPTTPGVLPGNWSRAGANASAGSSTPGGTTQAPGGGLSNGGGAQTGSPSHPRPRPRRAVLPERDELIAFCEANRIEDQRWRSSHYQILRACIEREGLRFSNDDWGRIHRRSLNSSNAEAKRLLTRRGWSALTYSITAVERLYSARPIEDMDRELEDLIHGGFQAEDDSPCAQGYFSRFYRELMRRVDPALGMLDIETVSGHQANPSVDSTQTSSLLPHESSPNELVIEVRQGRELSDGPQTQPSATPSLNFGRMVLRDLSSNGVQNIARQIDDLVSSGRSVTISGWLLDFRVGSSADVSSESVSALRRALTQVGILARPAAAVPGPEGMLSSGVALSISIPRTVPVIVFVSEQTRGLSEILALELKGLEKTLLVGAARTQGYARSGICTRSCELPGAANPVRIRTACQILSTPDGRTSDGHPVSSEIFLSVRAQNSPSVILDWLEQLARGRTPGDWPLRRNSSGSNLGAAASGNLATPPR